MMGQDTNGIEFHQKRHGLLKDQVQLVKRRDSVRYEIVPIQDRLSFEKGFFAVIRACQLLSQKNDGIILVGVAGPSGAGKTVFTEKILNFLPSVAVISMDNYNDASRIVDGNFDDPRLTDYDTLLKNLEDLKEGKQVEVPIYDFKSSSRVGYRTLDVPASRIVIIEGIYALSEKLRPLLDLRVSVTGGVHFDLVKRVLRDIQRAGQQPEEIIHQISETVYPMYKAFIEPDLQTAQIKIINKFNPFTGFQSPTYILKSRKDVSVDQIKAVLSEGYTENKEETYDIYLLPPGEDPESCQSHLRMRNKDGKYSLMFEEWVTDTPFVISPRITFEVSVRLLGGLMALGYTIATILKRNSHVFATEKVCVKIDWLEQLNRHYMQVQGKDRQLVQSTAEQLGLEGSFIPRTYIEQIQLEKLINEVMALPDDLKHKLSLDEDLVSSSSPKEALLRASADRVAMRNKNLKRGMSHSYSTQRDKNLSKLAGYSSSDRRYEERNHDSPANEGFMTQLSEQISSLNERMDEFTNRIEELNSKLSCNKNSPTQQSMTVQAEVCNGSAPTSYFISSLDNGCLTNSIMPHSSSSSQLAKDSPLMEEISTLSRGQRQVMHQLDNLCTLMRESSSAERSRLARTGSNNRSRSSKSFFLSSSLPLKLTALALCSVGIVAPTSKSQRGDSVSLEHSYKKIEREIENFFETMVVDQDQQWLLGCLTASLDPNQNVRSFAETSLNQASLQPGFGSALCRVAANKVLSLGLRQISFLHSAVLLKQFIKKHWRENDEDFEYPLVSSEEKDLIRGLLLGSLDDSHRKICTAISMDISSIATYDWPEEWPELLPFLLKLISDQNNINGVHGALRCLALLSGDLDDKDVPTLVPVLFPCLHAVVSSPQSYDKYMRGKALSIFYSCISVLGAMSGVYKTETTTLVTPLLKVWMIQFSLILEHPVQPDDPDDWSLRMEVLKCLNQFVQNFPFLMESELIAIMRPLWHTFESSLQVYLRSSVEGAEDSYDGRYDSDGEEKSLDTFVIQLFEFLSTIVSSRRLAKVIASNVGELVYQTVAFLQVTEQQVHTWSTDVNQFVADEDEGSFSCRISGKLTWCTTGILLLEEVVNTFGREGINAVVDAAGKRFHESQNEKIAGSSSWWRIREAALYALASLADQLVDAEDLGTDHANLAKFIEQLIMEDTGTGHHECPFLYARIFTAVARFSSEINPGLLEHFLNAAVRAINMDVPPPVKVGACRALLQLLPDMNRSVILPQIMNLFSSLTDLLHQASDETLILVLETLQQAIKAGHEASASIESIISPVILNVWVAHVSDPFISIDIIDVLEGAPSDVVKTAYEFCFDAVIRIILHSEDNSELQNATECLAAFISSGRQELLSWSGDPSFTMRSLLDAASRLLNPDLECSGSLFAGKYILQLILHLPSEMAPHVQDLVAALVRRMQSAEISGFRSSLLLIFARLVHMSFPNIDQFINLLVSVPADGHENSFAYVMTEWTKQQGEIQGAYQIKVTCSALALLLSTRHSEFAKVNVPGNRIQSNGGITTRSKAKSAPEQWTIIPLPMKVLALLADTLIEIQEQVLGCEDEDSEWEEVDEVNVEGEKDLLRSTGASQSSKPSYDQLEAMARTFENQDDGDGDDDFHVTDPLNEINLASYLADFMLKFLSGDRPLFDNVCQGLTNAQRNVIQTVLNR
ncbi:unnamed protein product [Brassica oleracea var. botrytis]